MTTLRHVVRVVLLALIAFALLGVVIAVAASETGAAEKAVFIAAGLVLVWAAAWVRRHAI